MIYENDFSRLRKKHKEELDAIDVRCALTDASFDEMMASWGLPCTDYGFRQIYHLGDNCFIRKQDYPKFEEVIGRHEKEMEHFLRTDDGLKQAMIWEFCNHEAMFAEWQYDEALRALNICPEALREREARIYKRARKEFFNLCVKNDWF